MKPTNVEKINQLNNDLSVLSKRVSRRHAIGTAGKVGIGVAAAAIVAGGGAAAYFASRPAMVETSTVTQQASTVTQQASTVTQQASTITSTSTSVATTTATTTATTVSYDPVAEAQVVKSQNPGDRFLIGSVAGLGLTLEESQEFEQAGKQAADALGLDYETIDVSSASPADQLNGVRSLISKGAKGILGAFFDSSVLQEAAAVCQQNKVFFATFWQYVPFNPPWATGDYYFKYTTQDGDTDDYVVSSMAFAKMKGQGTLCHVQGTADFPSNAFKNEGIWRAWQNFPNIKLAGHFYGQWTIDGGKAAMEQTLAENPNIGGIVTVNDGMSTGALTAATDRGLDIGGTTTGVDGHKTPIGLIVNGQFFATSSFHEPFCYGLAVCQMYDAAVGVYYPTPSERMTYVHDALVILNPADATTYANAANIKIPYKVAPAKQYYDEIFGGQTFPWNWTSMSRSKSKEKGVTYDPTGGYQYGGEISMIDMFGSETAFSTYIADALGRFRNFTADTLDQAKAPPFSPTSVTPATIPYKYSGYYS